MNRADIHPVIPVVRYACGYLLAYLSSFVHSGIAVVLIVILTAKLMGDLIRED